MQWLLPPILALLCCSAPAALANADEEEALPSISDPQFYSLLEHGTVLECRFAELPEFGFVLEKISKDTVSIKNITRHEISKDPPQFAEVRANRYNGIYLFYHKRQGNLGTYIEFDILNRKSAEVNYRFPGLVMITSAIYSKSSSGEENEELSADTKSLIGCSTKISK